MLLVTKKLWRWAIITRANHYPLKSFVFSPLKADDVLIEMSLKLEHLSPFLLTRLWASHPSLCSQFRNGCSWYMICFALFCLLWGISSLNHLARLNKIALRCFFLSFWICKVERRTDIYWTCFTPHAGCYARAPNVPCHAGQEESWFLFCRCTNSVFWMVENLISKWWRTAVPFQPSLPWQQIKKFIPEMPE